MGILYICKSTSTDDLFKIGIAATEKHLNVRLRFHSVDGYRGNIFKIKNYGDEENCFLFESPEYKKIERQIKNDFMNYRVGNTELFVNNYAGIKDYVINTFDGKDISNNISTILKIEINKNEEIKLNNEANEMEQENDLLYNKNFRERVIRSKLGIVKDTQIYYVKLNDEGKHIIAYNIDDDQIYCEGLTGSISRVTKLINDKYKHFKKKTFSGNLEWCIDKARKRNLKKEWDNYQKTHNSK
ncbi:MAG: GIY-YIG nuclease family protein [Acholeplasmatales bacterium]|jgi:hypothetical protein|nr:GIY-YIG nuclease family protein [Acholeplasmatales bacterium]